MTPSRLLKSWATPPASRPTASIFWAWRNWASSCLRSVTSRRETVPAGQELGGDLELDLPSLGVGPGQAVLPLEAALLLEGEPGPLQVGAALRELREAAAQ